MRVFGTHDDSSKQDHFLLVNSQAWKCSSGGWYTEFIEFAGESRAEFGVLTMLVEVVLCWIRP